MINALWLLLIVPVCVSGGFVIASFIAAAKDGEEK